MTTRRSGKCSVCTHPRRGEIDRDLLQIGDSAPVVAERYSLGRESVRRHRNNHLQVSTQAVNQANNAMTIVGYAHDLYQRALRVLDVAEQQLAAATGADSSPSRSVQAAAATLREVRSSIELLAKLVVTEPESQDESRNGALDARIEEALASIQMRALPPGDYDVAEAELVAE